MKMQLDIFSSGHFTKDIWSAQFYFQSKNPKTRNFALVRAHARMSNFGEAAISGGPISKMPYMSSALLDTSWDHGKC